MTYTIRPYDDGDAEMLPVIWRAAVAEIGPHKYSAEQVEAWLKWEATPDRFRERIKQGACVFIAADAQDQPVAYALLEPDGHLDHLYNHPRHSRRGLASKLLAAAETAARARGMTRVYTEASELARPVFERAGYEVTHRRNFEVEGVAIHNYAMEKALG